MRIPAVLLAGLLLGSSPSDDSFVLSVAARPNLVPLSESVTLVITLTNRSDKPRYVHRDVGRQLDFAVRGADGRLLRGFMHPPGAPLIPSDARHWVRIEGKEAFRCVSEMPLVDLGIERAGVFSLTGFWYGASAKVPKVDLKFLTFNFEHAQTTDLTITGNKVPADVGPRPTAPAPGEELPQCLAAEAERQPAQ